MCSTHLNEPERVLHMYTDTCIHTLAHTYTHTCTHLHTHMHTHVHFTHTHNVHCIFDWDKMSQKSIMRYSRVSEKENKSEWENTRFVAPRNFCLPFPLHAWYAIFVFMCVRYSHLNESKYVSHIWMSQNVYCIFEWAKKEFKIKCAIFVLCVCDIHSNRVCANRRTRVCVRESEWISCIWLSHFAHLNKWVTLHIWMGESRCTSK